MNNIKDLIPRRYYSIFTTGNFLSQHRREKDDAIVAEYGGKELWNSGRYVFRVNETIIYISEIRNNQLTFSSIIGVPIMLHVFEFGSLPYLSLHLT